MFDETLTIAVHGPMASKLWRWTKEGEHAMLYMTIRSTGDYEHVIFGSGSHTHIHTTSQPERFRLCKEIGKVKTLHWLRCPAYSTPPPYQKFLVFGPVLHFLQIRNTL
jgi:hypothetical protein